MGYPNNTGKGCFVEEQLNGSGALLLGFIWLLNFGISWFNARSVGQAWPFAKLVGGGWLSLLLWAGAIMSACGFTWCLLIPLSIGAWHFGYLPEANALGAIKLGYLIIIGPVLGSGLVIAIHSWIEFYQRPGLLNGATAAYNTWAQIENTMSAIQAVPEILGDLKELFSGGGDSDSDSDLKGKFIGILLLIVAFSLVGGILLTTWIVRSNARAYSVMFGEELRQQREQQDQIAARG